MNRTILILLVSFLVLSSQFSTAQTTNEKYNWELFQETEGVKIYTKIQERHDLKYDIHQEYIVLKFENTTSNNLNLAWNTELWYNDKCINCNSVSEEHNFQLALNANSIIEGNIHSDNDLKIFKRFLNYKDKSELTKFELANLTVN